MPGMNDSPSPPPRRPSIVHHSIAGRFAVRRRQWKLVNARESGGWSLPENPVAADAPKVQLYDPAADSSETTHLAAERPDIVGALLPELEDVRHG